MMLDVSDLYMGDTEGSEKDEVSNDVRSSMLTNRSIFTIKKIIMRKEALEVTSD
jgi:hypothetical protein